jgi:DNA-binding transcriptional LysR family regulator
VELRHLRSFLAVVEELHFSRAAARLHISQPPLSQQIRRLEDELGARLFRRTKRRVELTPAGQTFLIEARQTLAQAERAVRAAQRAERGELGELVVGYVPSATYGPLPDVIRMFRKRFPDVDLRLQNLRSVQQRQALVDRQIDVGFVRPQVADPHLSYEAIWRESVVVALPGNHPLTRRTIVVYRPRAITPANGDARHALAAALLQGTLTVDELIGRYCTLVYAQTGSQAETARRLGLDRRTVRARIDRGGLAALGGAPGASGNGDD